jgi:FkbM family methyltransferase
VESFAAWQQGKGSVVDRWDIEVSQCASLFGRNPEVAVDVGANRGLYSAELLKRFPRCRVHAFEPSPRNTAILREQFVANAQLVVHEVALSSSTGRTILWTDRPGSGLGSLVRRRIEHFGIEMNHSDDVATVRFDEFAKAHAIQRVDWMKLDVEGHELAVLEGMGEMLASVGVIQFEFGGWNIDSRTFFQDFWYLFRHHGFRIFRLAPRGPSQIARYDEMHECFRTTNFVAVGKAAR